MAKYSGEDIFLAIGEVDADLLAYPKRQSSYGRYAKPLAAAACFVLIVSFVVVYFVKIVFGGAMMEDKGDNMSQGSDGFDSNSGNGSGMAPGDVTSLGCEIYIYPEGHSLTATQKQPKLVLNVTNSLQIPTNNSDIITLYVPEAYADDFEINVLRVTGNYEKCAESEGIHDYLGYSSELEGIKGILILLSGEEYYFNIEISDTHATLTKSNAP